MTIPCLVAYMFDGPDGIQYGNKFMAGMVFPLTADRVEQLKEGIMEDDIPVSPTDPDFVYNKDQIIILNIIKGDH